MNKKILTLVGVIGLQLAFAGFANAAKFNYCAMCVDGRSYLFGSPSSAPSNYTPSAQGLCQTNGSTLSSVSSAQYVPKFKRYMCFSIKKIDLENVVKDLKE